MSRPCREDSANAIPSGTHADDSLHGLAQGTFQGRPVAVKRLLSHFSSLHSHEVSLLQSSDAHPNIVRYFCQEKEGPWLLIALELCSASLADVVDRPKEFPELAHLFDPQEAVRDICEGVQHLHELKICHRDLKPQSVHVPVFWPVRSGLIAVED